MKKYFFTMLGTLLHTMFCILHILLKIFVANYRLCQYIKTNFILIKFYPIVQNCYNLFNLTPINQQLCCFLYFSIKNNATVDTFMHSLFFTCKNNCFQDQSLESKRFAFLLLIDCQIAFNWSWVNLSFHQKCLRIFISPHCNP